MPDGCKRKRRNGCKGLARMRYYAKYRQIRFAKRLLGS